ncbi:MAG: helix-turn-helix domain-containing protein [Clostridia bacterium]|nr:helix-turn-helix domain-containing protein [Clostridia bacterium]
MTIRLSENIKKLREQKGVTQGELAEKLSVTPQSVSRWEKGQAMPDIEKLPQIACYFGVTIDFLMGTAEPSLYSISRELVEIRTQLREEKTPERMLKYLELLEMSINSGSNIFLSEYLATGERMKREGNLIEKERADSIYETVRGKLLDMLPRERERKLIPIVINEDEEDLERWSDLVADDNTFSCWRDYLLNRYLHNNDDERFTEVRREHAFDEIGKLLYMITQKSSHYVGGIYHSHCEAIENCRLASDLISVFSKRDDDAFIFHRITVEGRILGTLLAQEKLDSAYEAMERIKELLRLCSSLIGKTLNGSVELFDGLAITADRERFEHAMFDIDMIMMTGQMQKLRSEDERFEEFARFVEAVHREIDPFYFIESKEKFEMLYNRALAVAKKQRTKYLSYSLALETSKGNVYELYIPDALNEGDEEKNFFNLLRWSADTQITRLVGFLCDSNNKFNLDLPSARLREALAELDARNLDTEILLNGRHFFDVKQNRVTLSPSVLLKYE